MPSIKVAILKIHSDNAQMLFYYNQKTNLIYSNLKFFTIMKNNTYRPKSLLLMLATMLIPFFAFAQTPYSVVATGLKSPAGLEVDAMNQLWLTQAGTGRNDGSVSILKPNGMSLPIVTGLPSVFDTAVQEISGAWHTLMLPNNQFAVVTGEGTNPYAGSVLFFNLNGFTPGVTASKTAAMNTRQIMVSTFMHSKGIANSNPFSAAMDASNNVYVADAAANTVAKFNAANVGTIVRTFPDFANTTPVGSPVINQVTTKIIARPDGGFYLSTLTGFPFIEGKATIYAISTEGVVTPYKTGMSLITDLALDPNTGDLYALQLASFSLQTFGFAPNSSKITRIKPDGSTQIVATGFGPASGMALDQMGSLYVSETFSGRVLKFANTVVEGSTAFFNEDFNRGIPATWTSTAGTGTTAKFVSCDSTCLKDYERFSFGVSPIISSLNRSMVGGIEFNTVNAGAAALKAVKQTTIDATLTSPAINCSGKNKVFIRFMHVLWGGANSDSLQASANAKQTCVLRVSKDGTTWKEYKFVDFNIRAIGSYFLDISEVAANQSRVFVQFRRTGAENNQLWAIDDVSLTDVAPMRSVTVAVDMSSERLSPKGVYIAQEMKDGDWKPNAVKMMDMGNGMYSGTIPVGQLEKIHYKFMNGDSWGENESVPMGCGEKNAAGYYDRYVIGGDVANTLEPVCFGACMSCGNRKPQSSYMYCPGGTTTLYCENFESLKEGKLIPQSTKWSTPSLMVGAPLAVATGIPMVTSYWSGFTNFDGSKAMRVQSNFTGSNPNYDNPLLDLNDPMTGTYQIDFKMYIPHNTGGNVDFLDHDGNPGMGIYYSDSIYFATGFDYVTLMPIIAGKGMGYKMDDWNDVSIMFNAATNKTMWKFNNKTLFDGTVADNPGYAYLEFLAIDVFTQSNVSEMFIDDIVYRRVTPAEPPVVDTHPTVAKATVSPNPANEKLLVTPDHRTTEDWQVRLINQLGQVVETQRGSASTPIEFSTINYQSGIYVVDFQSETTKWTKKVMIKH
jgi:hypothetical protein